MDIATEKILSQIVNQLGIADDVFLPVNKKLGAMTFYDYMKDDELMELLNNERLSRLVEDMGILGIAIPTHSRKFISHYAGREAVKYLINNSTAKNKFPDLDVQLDSQYADKKTTGFEGFKNEESK